MFAHVRKYLYVSVSAYVASCLRLCFFGKQRSLLRHSSASVRELCARVTPPHKISLCSPSTCWKKSLTTGDNNRLCKSFKQAYHTSNISLYFLYCGVNFIVPVWSELISTHIHLPNMYTSTHSHYVFADKFWHRPRNCDPSLYHNN